MIFCKPTNIKMETINNQTLTNGNTNTIRCKALMLNGQSTIESCTDNRNHGASVFLEDSMLLFVKEGNLRFRHGNVDYILEKTQVAFLRKNILIEYPTVSQLNFVQNLRYIRIHLKSDIVKDFLKQREFCVSTLDESLPVMIDNADTRLLQCVDSLEPYFVEHEQVDGPLTKIKLLELLFNLVKSNKKILTQLMDLREQFRTDITTTVEENIMNSLSLRQLADLSGRSLSSFRRDFMAIYKVPPSQWVRQKRLEKALDLLRNTTMTVTDVCYTLGFENLAHFSRLFKSYFGFSPSRSRLPLMVA